jgi:tellurite methyltransferase
MYGICKLPGRAVSFADVEHQLNKPDVIACRMRSVSGLARRDALPYGHCMSAEERERWNAHYREAGQAPEQPARLLRAIGDLLPTRGRALDVAGGSGRNALWLARRGLDVTMVDIAEEGLALARQAAQRQGTPLRTVCRDLDGLEHLEAGSPLQGPWDVIVVVHFLLRSLLPGLAASLAPGGVLVLAHPTVTNLQHHARPPRRYLLEDREILGLLPGLEPVLYREGWNEDGRHEAEIVARRAR